MSESTRLDAWLTDSGPAAVVLREPMIPVEGEDGVVFPPTYAAAEDRKKFEGGYNIDQHHAGNVCLIDSVGAQANRIEPIFLREPYSLLVPQITVRAGHRAISLLEAGHRAADALVRCSALKEELQAAFQAVLRGDAGVMAKIAPTSLVFGVWDSRDTQAKIPRIVTSTIRAFNVQPLRRSAQYVPATDYIAQGLLSDPGNDKKRSDAYSERGFAHVPATGTHGGVIATGGIRRDATLSLAGLRLLRVREGTPPEPNLERTLALQRYILGLALVALTAPAGGQLRQGCLLVRNPTPQAGYRFVLVFPDGRDEPCTLTHEHALKYAQSTAQAFGVGASREVAFDPQLAEQDLMRDGDEGSKRAKAKKK